MKKINFNNYDDNTIGEFKLRHTMSDNQVFKTRKRKEFNWKLIKNVLYTLYPNKHVQKKWHSKGSLYFTVGKSKLVRVSDHWSNEVGTIGNCFWTISDNKRIKRKNKWKIGVISLKDLKEYEGE